MEARIGYAGPARREDVLMKLKYEPLEDYLKKERSSRRAVNLSFAEIETIIGSSLPRSAYTYREWWSNQTDVSNRPQAKAWIQAGYGVDSVQQQRNAGTVRFIKREV